MTFIFFILDIYLRLKTRPDYKGSVLFYLDLLGTICLLLDIGWLNQLFFDNTAINIYGVLARGARSALVGNKL